MSEARLKRNRLISECPVCTGPLYVSHLKCGECGTELTGEFVANEFARLPQDKLDFLRVFLACRGNLKEVEGVLGLSYPTVRGRLDALIEQLRLSTVEESASSAGSRVDVLAALERGEITVEEAAAALRGQS
ncbi:DUF2089 domain-containing protein [bacterium]|nr:DUF2089 domain-containing protein [bacterium]